MVEVEVLPRSHFLPRATHAHLPSDPDHVLLPCDTRYVRSQEGHSVAWLQEASDPVLVSAVWYDLQRGPWLRHQVQVIEP